jgi:hypothetical protein
VNARVRVAGFVVGGLTVVVALAFFLAPQASSQPDALTKVAEAHGIAAVERPHPLDDLPNAGYGFDGVDDDALSTALAGGLGVGVTFVVGAGVVLALRRLRPTD